MSKSARTRRRTAAAHRTRKLPRILVTFPITLYLLLAIFLAHFESPPDQSRPSRVRRAAILRREEDATPTTTIPASSTAPTTSTAATIPSSSTAAAIITDFDAALSGLSVVAVDLNTQNFTANVSIDAATAASNNISTLYAVVWYGSWGPGYASVSNNIQSGLANLYASDYWGILQSYTQANGTHVSGPIHLGPSTTDPYSQGTNLDSTQYAAIINRAFGQGIPIDTAGIIAIVTSPDVTFNYQGATSCSFNNGMWGLVRERCLTVPLPSPSQSKTFQISTFLSESFPGLTISNDKKMCGFHAYLPLSSGTNNIKFAVVGNPAVDCPCPSGLLSYLLHELSEATTDPLLSSYYTSQGNECADLCSNQYTEIRLGSSVEIVQMMLDINSQTCRSWASPLASYIGCFSDNLLSRDMAIEFSDSSTTVDSCIASCSQKGYLFAAVS
ncbi:hypothetical protein BDK51DRAFT_26686 [Blyttiomyces helicus]|uniref:Uncharacterized protein n=1 Tax=Blyttiomyces helicus TaxID=388810 RepID=A0A4P9WC99_9FUNG|nr:hypothetical protein BDK51DRAFT_26686 [Blyttiomyces helicus]|eukprot:RKO88828.1 hypothetical protein BDK51DRAFT_26686 [Blyttiomyces helicus]